MIATLRWLGVMLGSTLLAVVLLGVSGYVALVAWDRTHPPSLPGMEREGPAPAPGLAAKRAG